MAERTCSIESCGSRVLAKDLCGRHYQQRRRADPVAPRCAADGCDAAAFVKGLCNKHYKRKQSTGDPLGLVKRPKWMPCEVVGCPNLNFSSGLCRKHYATASRHGDPLIVVKHRQDPICRRDGCDVPSFQSSLCQRHFSREYKAANREWILERDRLHRKANPEQYSNYSNNRRAAKMGAPGYATSDEKQQITLAYRGTCAVTGCGQVARAWDHLVPLSRRDLGPTNWPDNLAPICKSHNSQKHDKTRAEFIVSHGLVIDLGPHPFIL